MIAYIYIPTNRKDRALYSGVTRNLPPRMMRHRSGKDGEHCARYGITRLVYVEEAPTMLDAIAREKQIKH